MTPQDERGDDLLTGKIDTADAEVLRAAVASYRAESLLWAERRSAAMPSLVPAARRARLWAAVPRWSLVTVAVFTVAVGMAHYGNTTQPAIPVEVSTDATPATPKELADDNALLKQIDAAVNAKSDLPADALGLQVRHAANARGNME